MGIFLLVKVNIITTIEMYRNILQIAKTAKIRYYLIMEVKNESKNGQISS